MTVKFHPRKSLGLIEPVRQHLTVRSDADNGFRHEGITWHWTGSDGTLYRPDPIRRLRAIAIYHVLKLGYGDIAYHAAFDADANTYGLRDDRYVGAHARSTLNEANRLTDGVVFLEDSRGWTAGAQEAFDWWVNVEHLTRGRRPSLYCHEWWAHGKGGTPTECPGPYIRAVVGRRGGHV